jgi:quercetin dioxygenase-like cupin family protein
MKAVRTIAIAATLIAASFLALPAAQAQQGVKRTDLQQHDLSIPGRETIQARIDIAPGVLAPRHTHHGEEVIYVLEGTLEYTLDGKPPVTLKAGDVLFIPNGAVHSARNTGNVNAAELATYIVEKGKALVTAAK